MTKIHDLETPAVLIDLPRMERNILQAQERCTAHGINLRAHVKTHKIPEIARMQIDAGAIGIACQKLSEAEVFAEAGFANIQIPYNIVGPLKTERLTDLVIYNRLTVSADHSSVIHGLSEFAKRYDLTIRVMVELATHIERTGAQPEDMVPLATRIEEDEKLHFAGVLLYPSDATMRPTLEKALQLLHEAGLGVDSVSGGGTGVLRHLDEMPDVTEIRAGTYVFNDWKTVLRRWTDMDNCALTVASSVISRPTVDRIVLDAGSKTLSSASTGGGYGFILEYPDAYIYQLSVEHAHVDMSKCPEKPVIGERVHIIPVHCGQVMNLHNEVVGFEGDEVRVVWPVAARGMVW